MAIVKAKAYIPSLAEIKSLQEKIPAFVAADVSEKAKEQGAWVVDNNERMLRKGEKGCGVGMYPLRNLLSSSNEETYVLQYHGKLSTATSFMHTNGLRVCLNLNYNPKSKVVKKVKKVTRTSLVWNQKEEKNILEKSTAPVVKFAGIEYIWTNKEDCENGKTSTMNLISLELIARAKAFDPQGKEEHNDYAKAKEFHTQCEEIVFENATEEEKSMAIEIEMSSEDGYETLTPVPASASEDEVELV